MNTAQWGLLIWVFLLAFVAAIISYAGLKSFSRGYRARDYPFVSPILGVLTFLFAFATIFVAIMSIVTGTGVIEP